MIVKMRLIVIVVGLFQIAIVSKVFSSDSLQFSYKKIGDELVDIRKKYPDVQAKIYSILDQVDKLYKVARVSVDENNSLNKKLKEREVEAQELMKTKDLESISLQNEMIALKSVLDSTQHKLEITTKNLELEKQYSGKLTKEIANLSQTQEKKILLEQQKADKALLKTKNQKKNKKGKTVAENASYKEKTQSLSLTSTSAPSSPR